MRKTQATAYHPTLPPPNGGKRTEAFGAFKHGRSEVFGATVRSVRSRTPAEHPAERSERLRTAIVNLRKVRLKMTEEQFKRLSLWQATAATISNSFERYCEALQLFGGDYNFAVWLDGSVRFIDHANSMTFEEYCEGIRVRVKR